MRKYKVTITKLGREAGLPFVEEVHVNESNPQPIVVSNGTLQFTLGNGRLAIYAPGMWALVTGGENA